MFYCVKCAKENNWPEPPFRSAGPCEMCGKHDFCYDVPSKYLFALEKGKVNKETGEVEKK